MISRTCHISHFIQLKSVHRAFRHWHDNNIMAAVNETKKKKSELHHIHLIILLDIRDGVWCYKFRQHVTYNNA